MSKAQTHTVNDLDIPRLRREFNAALASRVRRIDTDVACSYLKQRCPTLLKAAQEDSDVASVLRHATYVFQLMEDIQLKRIPYDQATKDFGQRMFDTYVEKNIPKTS